MVTMSVRRRRRLLICVNAALVAGVLGCVCLALLLPPAVNSSEPGIPDRARTAGEKNSTKLGPPDAYAVIYQRDLRKPLFDPKPVVVSKPPPKKPKFNAELLGAVEEPGFSYGIFRTGGRDKLVSVGGTVAGAKLLAIGPGSARLKFNGELITLNEKKGDRK